MKCKWDTCNKEARDKSPFCSGTCKKRFSRSSGTNVAVDASGTAKQYTANEDMVYGRQSVSYLQDGYETRPEPLNLDDIPHKGGRGKYTRQDGTVYQFDSSGKAFEVVEGNTQPVTLEHYQANPDQYAQRTNPLNLNWGKRMTLNELNQAGFKGNRVAIPGDHDYVKVTQ